MTLKLDSKQTFVVEDIMKGNHEGAAILAGQLGSGKTNVAVEVTRRMGWADKVILLACPVKGTRVGWIRTFKQAGFTGDIKFLENKTKENFEDLLDGVPGLYIIERSYLAGAASVRGKREPLIAWNKAKRVDYALFDESHFASNRQSAAFRHWSHIKPKSIKMAISGTWFGNRFEGAWAVTRALWPSLIDKSFWRWVDTWSRKTFSCPHCYIELEDGDAGLCPRCYGTITARNIIRGIDAETHPGSFAESLPAYYYWEPDLDEDDPARASTLKHPLFVELSPKHRKAYRQMENQALAWLEDNPLEADVPISQHTRLRQLSLGYLSVEETGDFDEDGVPEQRVWFEDNAESPKIDALNEFIADHPDENLFVVTDSRIFAEILPGRLKTKGGVTLWTGATKHSERERTLSEWGTRGKGNVLVATIPSIAEGVDGLQHVCNTIVWLNKSTNGLLNEQVLGRLKRRGQKNRVLEVEITAVETKDEPDNNRLDRTLTDRRSSMGKEITPMTMVRTLEGLKALKVGTRVTDRLGDTWTRDVVDGHHPSVGDYPHDVLRFDGDDWESLEFDGELLVTWYGPFEIEEG